MENQEKKESSLEYFYERVLESFEYNTDEYYAINDALNEAKKMYELELMKAFEKGYIEGCNYTDGLIRGDKFPF